MSLIKKIDVEKHFAARRAMRLGRSGPLSQAGAGVERTVRTTSDAALIEVATPTPVVADPIGTSVSSATRSRQA
jgi:hypothetical protein